MPKKKLAIFDLTDCEGCELQIINLKEKLLILENNFEIVNWRLLLAKNDQGPFDFSLIEGNPVKPEEVRAIKKIREVSKIVVALGACAMTGGVPSMIDENKRKALTAKIYGSKYKAKATSAEPINSYIKVDYYIPGCPADQNQIERSLSDLIFDKDPTPHAYPVCLECKMKENKCLLLAGQPCLGPATQGGCGAICTSKGLACYGCWGIMRNGNLRAIRNVFKRDLKMSEEQIKQRMNIFWRELDEYKKFIKG